MIEKMKKYSFLVYHKEYDTFLEEIRALGVVHVIETQNGAIAEDSALGKTMDEAKRMDTAVNFLDARLKENKKSNVRKETPDEKETRLAGTCNCTDGMKRLTHLEELKLSVEKTQASIQLLNKEIEKMEVWGDFNIDLLHKLKAAGYLITFYSCAERNYREEWGKEFNAIVIGRAESMIYFVTVTRGPLNDEITADKQRLPDSSYSELQKEKRELHYQAERLQKAINHAAFNDLEDLKHAAVDLHNSITFDTVKLNSEATAEQKVQLLEGWVPVVKEQGLISLLDQKAIYYHSQEPTQEDKVPVLLRNNRFTRLFEVIGNLYSLPSYHGIDLTPYFAPFYMMFFGICMGDLGYGILMTVGSLILIRKVKETTKPVFRLMMWLGIGTMIFGTLGGTFFGIPLAEQSWPFLDHIKEYMLTPSNLFNFALILGLIQISFGMIIKAVVQIVYRGFKYSLDTWGWLLCIYGNGGIYLLSTHSQITPDVASYAYMGVNAVAFTCMLFFNDPDSSILANFGGGLWGLYNKAGGLLGDTLSYIRLFALGISGGVLGLVFNKLAVTMSGDIPVVSTIIMVLILTLGHTMNFCMSGLGAFVHPMRLTFVEFYNNSSFEGGGKEYKPFKKEIKETIEEQTVEQNN